MANPTADWEKVGDKFYRKVQLYTAVFDQDLELENYIVTGCSFGGAVGMPLNFIWLEAFGMGFAVAPCLVGGVKELFMVEVWRPTKNSL
jgi:Vps16, N-terminal region